MSIRGLSPRELAALSRHCPGAARRLLQGHDMKSTTFVFFGALCFLVQGAGESYFALADFPVKLDLLADGFRSLGLGVVFLYVGLVTRDAMLAVRGLSNEMRKFADTRREYWQGLADHHSRDPNEVE